MQTTPKPGSASARADKPLPVAIFKNSLRAWQARYKAQRAGRASGPSEPGGGK